MKVFRNLTIQLNDVPIDELIDSAEQICPENWSRDTTLEADGTSTPDRKPFCFVHGGSDGLPTASLWLFQQDSEHWYVSNIVPRAPGQLSIVEYNAILLDFVEKVLEPSIKVMPIRFEVSTEDQTLSDVSDISVVEAFNLFSAAANKSTGSAHPSDRIRWFDFLTKAANYHDISYDLIIFSLVEAGWPPEVAHDLASEYSFGVDLLRHQTR